MNRHKRTRAIVLTGEKLTQLELVQFVSQTVMFGRHFFLRLRAMRRMLTKLDRLPERRLYPVVRRRLQTEFENRLGRIRRRLGLPVGRPRAQTWYRATDAARLIGVSRKTLVRWVAAGRVQCERAHTYKHPRYFHRRELARVIASLKV